MSSITSSTATTPGAELTIGECHRMVELGKELHTISRIFLILELSLGILEQNAMRHDHDFQKMVSWVQERARCQAKVAGQIVAFARFDGSIPISMGLMLLEAADREYEICQQGPFLARQSFDDALQKALEFPLPAEDQSYQKLFNLVRKLRHDQHYLHYLSHEALSEASWRLVGAAAGMTVHHWAEKWLRSSCEKQDEAVQMLRGNWSLTADEVITFHSSILNLPPNIRTTDIGRQGGVIQLVLHLNEAYRRLNTVVEVEEPSLAKSPVYHPVARQSLG